MKLSEGGRVTGAERRLPDGTVQGGEGVVQDTSCCLVATAPWLSCWRAVRAPSSKTTVLPGCMDAVQDKDLVLPLGGECAKTETSCCHRVASTPSNMPLVGPSGDQQPCGEGAWLREIPVANVRQGSLGDRLIDA